jgi:hypothetical protein
VGREIRRDEDAGSRIFVALVSAFNSHADRRVMLFFGVNARALFYEMEQCTGMYLELAVSWIYARQVRVCDCQAELASMRPSSTALSSWPEFDPPDRGDVFRSDGSVE